MDTMRGSRNGSIETWSCVCYVCGADALWSIGVSGEDESVEVVFACEKHARGHLHHAIVLPEHTSDRAPYVTRS